MTAFKIDTPKPIRTGEELNVGSLEDYLLANLPEARGTLSIEQFPSGYSNLTYLLKLGEQQLVLRRPPFGNAVKSAHDMGREYHVLSKLCGVFPPAPQPLAYCQDASVIGDEFYVMERRIGVILRAKNTPEALSSDRKAVQALCESLVDCLVDQHRVDYRAAGLADLGRPEGYAQRQVNGWIERFEKSKTDDVPAMDQQAKWIAANVPADQPPSLIHNDFKYDNLMLDSDDLSQIVAVLDWEMATIGDPLMDLGTTLAYWVGPDDNPMMRQGAAGPTFLEGSFSRQQLVDRYAERTGTDTSNILFYYCFGLYKLAVIVQQIYARYVCGETTDPRFANLNMLVHFLGATGVQAIQTGKL